MWPYIAVAATVLAVAAAFAVIRWRQTRPDDTSARYLANLPPAVPHTGADEQYGATLHEFRTGTPADLFTAPVIARAEDTVPIRRDWLRDVIEAEVDPDAPTPLWPGNPPHLDDDDLADLLSPTRAWNRADLAAKLHAARGDTP